MALPAEIELSRSGCRGNFKALFLRYVCNIVSITASLLPSEYLLPHTLATSWSAPVVFRPLADFVEKAELAIAFRTVEPSASVRAS